MRNCVVYLPLDNLDGVCGSVCLSEVLVVRNPVRIGDEGIRRVQVGEQIQRMDLL